MKSGLLNLQVFRLLEWHVFGSSCPMELQGVTHTNLEVGVTHVRVSDLDDCCLALGEDGRGRHASKHGFHHGVHVYM